MSTVPVRPPRSREYLAALATAALLAQLLLSQLTLGIAIALWVTGRISRWRPHWLAIPASAGLIWTLAAPGRAVPGYLATPRHLTAFLTVSAGHHGLAALIGSLARDLPGQLPLALLGGAAEAGGLMWLSLVLGGGRADWRPGLIAAMRRTATVRALAAGRTVTAAGCSVGVAGSTGRRAELTWSQAQRAVLVCGADAAALTAVCLPAVCAALRRRKAVVVACPADQAALGRSVAAMARSLGVEIADLTALGSPESLATLSAALGEIIRKREAVLAPPAAATAGGLSGALGELRDNALLGDTLVWIHCYEEAGERLITELIGRGQNTGTSLLLSTTSRTAAAAIAGTTEVVIAAGPVGHDAAVELAGREGETDRTAAVRAIESQPAGTFAIVAPRLLADCRTVPVLPGRMQQAVPAQKGPLQQGPMLTGRPLLTGAAGPADRA
jgi:hypothetical protein